MELKKHFMVASSLALVLLVTTLQGAQSVGVCNGGWGNNLPSKEETVELYKSNNITSMRIYDADATPYLPALQGTGIELMLAVPNMDLKRFASQRATAKSWVKQNIIPYVSDVNFRYIAVGNEVLTTDENIQFLFPAMQNVYSAILSAGLQGKIKVSTAIDVRHLGNFISYGIPSQASFSNEARPYMEPIINFLVKINSPLLANVYPYFVCLFNQPRIQLPYALFTGLGILVQDGQFGYQNLFDVALDALYTAVEKVGGSSLQIVVSESGWPSDEGTWATTDNAITYHRNLIQHVKEGTPKRHGQAIETYLFAMFDENEKPGLKIQRHFGLFYPNKQPKYNITFS